MAIEQKAQSLGNNCAADNVNDVNAYCEEAINATVLEFEKIDKFGIYTNHEHKFWPEVSTAAENCCKQLSDRSMTIKMGIMGCKL